jgi:hypothetical protein
MKKYFVILILLLFLNHTIAVVNSSIKNKPRITPPNYYKAYNYNKKNQNNPPAKNVNPKNNHKDDDDYNNHDD